MTGVARRSRRLVWLSPRAFSVAERLSRLTGVGVTDLLEVILLELGGVLDDDALEAAPPREARRQSVHPPARVIPIEYARPRRARAEASATRRLNGQHR